MSNICVSLTLLYFIPGPVRALSITSPLLYSTTMSRANLITQQKNHSGANCDPPLPLREQQHRREGQSPAFWLARRSNTRLTDSHKAGREASEKEEGILECWGMTQSSKLRWQIEKRRYRFPKNFAKGANTRTSMSVQASVLGLRTLERNGQYSIKN